MSKLPPVVHYHFGRSLLDSQSLCGRTISDPYCLTPFGSRVTCQRCLRMLNQLPADPLGPVAKLAREK